MEYYTADNHFNHANIIKYCRSRYIFMNGHEKQVIDSRNIEDIAKLKISKESVDRMNEMMTVQWNSKVRSKDDIVYIGGDLGFGDIRSVISRLNGRKILIQGDHDKSAWKCKDLFEKITPLLKISSHGQSITICHYAMRTWSKSHYNAWHLYGHSHGMLPPIGKSWDIGVDNNNFTPLSFNDIKEIMSTRPDNPNLVKNKRVK